MVGRRASKKLSATHKRLEIDEEGYTPSLVLLRYYTHKSPDILSRSVQPGERRHQHVLFTNTGHSHGRDNCDPTWGHERLCAG